MRISTSKGKTTTLYYIIKDYTKNGKRSTKIIDKIGNIQKITELSNNEGIDCKTWLNNYLQEYIKKHSNEKEEILIRKNTEKLITKGERRSYNVGYLFLKDIYYSLNLNEICKEIEEKHQFKFDLNNILSNLVFSRIIFPSSKLKTHELSKKFVEFPNVKLENIYRGLSYLSSEMDLIQEKIFENSLKVINRNSKVIYFDCTNYFFEINNEDNLRKYGINKQHQPSPQVGMGLFLDGDGLPLAFNIYPGNESETKHMLPLENKIVSKFKLKDSKFVVCTDAGLCTDEIKKYNIEDGRGFVITQSLKKLKIEYQKEALEATGWRISGDFKNVYNINGIEEDETLYQKYKNTLFYKIIQTETAHVKQDLIVTFSFKYKDYNKSIREGQITRARNKIKDNKNNEKILIRHHQNDYRRFIKETICIKDESLIEKYNYNIDENLIKEEEQFDGFYGLTTNLSDDIETILKVVKGRWEIEESFRIMKHDFLARPVELSREDRIKAHFMTCYISLLIYRILEKKLNNKYTTTQILETLKSMNVLELKGDGYVPDYVRTDLTDDLHEAFDFRTDNEILTYKNYKKIFDQIKN
ncbi:MAG: IS1634 family transposase [Cetobacterium sp.]